MRRIERVLRDAWGSAPDDELDELDREPVAVTPISQVHRGVLDGAPVAVKVFRPGSCGSRCARTSRSWRACPPAASRVPGVDAGAIVREVRERVLEELDLENEASAQRRFHRALRNHPSLTVPAPSTDCRMTNVLVSEWVDGVPLHRATGSRTAAAALLVFALGAARAGMIYADPDPDDVLSAPRRTARDPRLRRDPHHRPANSQTAAAALQAFPGRRTDTRRGRRAARLAPARASGYGAELAREALGDLAGREPVSLETDAVVLDAAAGCSPDRPARRADPRRWRSRPSICGPRAGSPSCSGQSHASAGQAPGVSSPGQRSETAGTLRPIR